MSHDIAKGYEYGEILDLLERLTDIAATEGPGSLEIVEIEEDTWYVTRIRKEKRDGQEESRGPDVEQV